MPPPRWISRKTDGTPNWLWLWALFWTIVIAGAGLAALFGNREPQPIDPIPVVTVTVTVTETVGWR